MTPSLVLCARFFIYEEISTRIAVQNCALGSDPISIGGYHSTWVCLGSNGILPAMDETYDQQQIREVIATWLRATAAGDVDQVLNLMSEDAVFLVPGQPVMRGRDAFAAALRGALQHVRIEATADVREIRVSGNLAYCWNHLTINATPIKGGEPKRREGFTITIYQKQA